MSAVNLIAVLDSYLILTFFLSVIMRYRQYRSVLGIVLAAPERWPHLVQVLAHHRTIFFTWPTLVPVALTFFLMLVHSIAYKFFWPAARLTPAELWGRWLALGCFVGFGCSMLFLDFVAIFSVWKFDRGALEKSLDQAEYWLRSWVTPVVSAVTFGFYNPRQIVGEEVRRSLTSASVDLNKMMWRWSLQIAVRLGFGLSLWLTWALL